jgi:large subunit ribosomal protein L29
MTKPADIRLKSPDELAEMLVDLRREQFNLRFQRATGQTEGQARIKVVRRDIARVKTILTERKASVTAA